MNDTYATSWHLVQKEIHVTGSVPSTGSLHQEPTVFCLQEGLATEVEKSLTNLVCYAMDKRIRMTFIKACVENIANKR